MLSRAHTDALQELGNIGAGHSATALTNFLNREISMGLPHGKLIKVEEIVNEILEGLPARNIALVQIETSERDFQIFLVFDEDSVKSIIYLMFRGDTRNVDSLSDLTELHQSLIKEIGNILLLQYLSAVNSFLKTDLFPQSAPILYLGDAESVVNEKLMLPAEHDDPIFLVEVDIFSQASDRPVRSRIFIKPSEKAVENLLEIMFGEDWDKV